MRFRGLGWLKLTAQPAHSGGKLLRVSVLDGQAVACARQVWLQPSIHKLRQTIEQHSFNSDVIVKILEILEHLDCASHMGVLRWGGVSR